MYTPIPPESHAALHEATTIILQKIPTTALYVFGSRSMLQKQTAVVPERSAVTKECFHFYMVVFTADTRSHLAAETCDLISTTTAERIRVTLLLHQPKQLKPNVSNQHYFFYTILQGAIPVYQDPAKPVYIASKPVPKRSIAASQRYWNQRLHYAKVIIDTEYQIESPDAELVKITLLSETVRLLCLGLIEVFLGYRPNHFSLAFLFDLCEYCCGCTADCFPRESLEDRKLFKLLCTPTGALRFMDCESCDSLATEILERRCQRFLAESTAAVATNLHRMETLNH